MSAKANYEILLVDDEPNILSSLTRLFRRKGHASLSATKGENAIQLLEQNQIAVVISDMKMPGMSGASFLKIVSERWPDTIRIALTGHADIQDTIDAINDAGVFQYVNKPWDDDALLDIIETSLQKYRDHQNSIETSVKEHQHTQALLSEKEALEREVEAKKESLEAASDKLANAYEDEKKLRQAQKEAELLNEAKSRFLASMSHEMRSPLNAIINMNALLLESNLNDDQRELAKLAHEGGQTLLALINDILDFSKIEAGKLELNSRWFKLVPLMEKVSELLASQALNKPIELCTIVAEDTPSEIYTDDVRLKQILVNLVSNAIKFTEEGGIHIRVSPLKAGIQIYIKDTGIGISKADQAHIFEDFFQVNSNKRKHAGTGLGLSICKQLIKLMDGHISVTSELKKGSCFRIYIPVESRNKITFDKYKHKKSLVFLDIRNHILSNCIREQLAFLNCEVVSHYNLSKNSYENLCRKIYQQVIIHDVKEEYASSNEYLLGLKQRLNEKDITLDFENFKQISLISSDGANRIAQLKSQGYSKILRKPIRLCKLIEAVFSGEELIDNISQADIQSSRKQPSTTSKTETTEKTINILLVEDSPANQAVVKAILSEDIYKISVADNGLEAVNMSNSDVYDIILMDVSMPVMDGLEATQKIRASSKLNKNTKIVAMTANAFTEDREKCLQAGMNDFLSKPIDVDEFLECLNIYCHQTQGREEDQDFAPPSLISEATLNQLINDTSLSAFPKILAIYVEETTRRIPRMLELCKKEQWSQLSDEAHTLKSSSGSYGAIFLQEKSAKIERSIADGNIENTRIEMSNIEDMARQSIQQLNEFSYKVTKGAL